MRKRLLAALPLLIVSSAWAQQPAISIGIENFSWREYEDGARLLKESGTRLVLGADWIEVMDRDVQLRVSGALYLARVDYDGQACTVSPRVCTPFMSDTDYTGARGEFSFAQRNSPLMGIEFFGGGGIDVWRRNIKGRGSVSGAIEDWTVLYALAGAGYFVTDSTRRFSVRAGMKYPFYVYEVPDSYDLVLNPKGAASFFVRVSADFLNNGKPSSGMGLYYDSYRFDKSGEEQTGSFIVWQPESRQDTLGVYGTFYF